VETFENEMEKKQTNEDMNCLQNQTILVSVPLLIFLLVLDVYVKEIKLP